MQGNTFYLDPFWVLFVVSFRSVEKSDWFSYFTSNLNSDIKRICCIKYIKWTWLSSQLNDLLWDFLHIICLIKIHQPIMWPREHVINLWGFKLLILLGCRSTELGFNSHGQPQWILQLISANLIKLLNNIIVSQLCKS